MSRTYRIGEFAALGGVTVRTLHHYDQLGLLRPSGRSEAGHRLYTEMDLLYLHQILTLRYLGFSLQRIGRLLQRNDFDLAASLEAQREVLRGRVTELEAVSDALDKLLRARRAGGRWDWSLVARASAAAGRALAERGTRMNDEQMMKRFEELGRRLRPGEREELEREWTRLIDEVKANLHLDPASPEARALEERWQDLYGKTFAAYQERGFEDLWQAVGRRMQDQGYADNPNAPSQEVYGFIMRVKEAR